MKIVSELKISYFPKIKPSERAQIKDSATGAKILEPFFTEWIDHKEVFFAILLNRANKVVGVFKLSEGGISGTVVDQRILFEAALLAHATGIILAHNHPSGQKFPSEADKSVTKKIKAACDIMEFQLLDHLILTSDGYYSFADEGLI